MDRDERLERIAELRERNEQARLEIERRQAEREADPYSVQETLLADRRVTRDPGDCCYSDPSEPAPSPPVRKNDDPGIASAPADDRGHGGAPSDDDDELVREVNVFVQKVEKDFDEHDHDIAELQTKVAKLESQLEILTALLGQKPKLWKP